MPVAHEVMETVIEIFRWVMGAVLAAIFVLFAIFNWWVVWRGMVRRDQEGVSLALVIGGLFGFASIMLLPVGSTSTRLAFAWTPFLLDGTLPYLVVGLIYAAADRRR